MAHTLRGEGAYFLFVKQFFTHFENWEDYKGGMYSCTWTNEQEYDLRLKAKTLLTNSMEFTKTIKLVFRDWAICTKQNLTNVSCNRRAWIGQASCCYKYGVPELITRMAWGELSEMEMNEANRVADIMIKHYELNYENENIKLHI